MQPHLNILFYLCKKIQNLPCGPIVSPVLLAFIIIGGSLLPFAFTAYNKNWYSLPGSKSVSLNSGKFCFKRRNGAVVACLLY